MGKIALLAAWLPLNGLAGDLVTKLGNDQPPPQAHPELATIVFLRPSATGFAVKPAILDGNGRFLGEIRAKGHFITRVQPGEHTFVSWGEATPAMRATVEAGRIYYVRIDLGTGAWTAVFRLFATGPSYKEWGKVGKWMRKTNRWQVNQAEGDAYVKRRANDVRVVLEKAADQWSGYDAVARAKRTLKLRDGVELPPR